MPAYVPHPDLDSAETMPNLPFFPELSLNDLAERCKIDKRMDVDIFKQIIQTNLLRVNSDLKDWMQCHQSEGIQHLKDVDGMQYGEQTEYEINYQQAITYGIKADVLRHFINYDLTKIGESEAEEKEDQAVWYAAQSVHAVRRILGKTEVRVTRIKREQQLETGVFYG